MVSGSDLRIPVTHYQTRYEIGIAGKSDMIFLPGDFKPEVNDKTDLERVRKAAKGEIEHIRSH